MSIQSQPTGPNMLAIDVGNTSIKFGLFATQAQPDEPAQARFQVRSDTTTFDGLQPWLASQTATLVCVASVCQPATARLSQWLSATCPDLAVRLLQVDDFPIPIRVRNPERVGLDRLAAAVAAAATKSAGHAAIVVDAGSAITVDLVSDSGVFEGGAILPGWQTMAAALQRSTDQLPLLSHLDMTSPPATVGKTTEEAISSGLFWGCAGAVRELVTRITEACSTPVEVVLAGGDMPALRNVLDIPARCEPDLVLRGIALTTRRLEI